MENQNNKANAFQHKRQPQDTNFQAQMKRELTDFSTDAYNIRLYYLS
jgi:hypothetical protein